MTIAPHLSKKKERTSPRDAGVATTEQEVAKKNSALDDANDIRTRLERDHGVKVKPALVNYIASTEGSPSMSQKRGAAACNDLGGAGDGSQHPPPPPTMRDGWRGRGCGRGGKRGGRNNRKNSSKWPSNAEQRPDPHRWDMRWSSPSRKGSLVSDIDTDWADAGGGLERRRKVADGAGYQLADFHGGWAPAPVDWESRPAFRESQSGSHIQSWLSGVDKEVHSTDAVLPLDAPMGVGDLAPNTRIILPEFAPRYWIPALIDNVSPQNFWDTLKNSEHPKPLDLGDLLGVEPWWTTYQNATILKPYEHPAIAGPSPDERQDERIARENDLGSNYRTENRRRTVNAQKEARRDQRKREQQRAEEIYKNSSRTDAHLYNETTIKRRANLYVRGAVLSDAKAICDLYNHYISNSVSVPECEPLTEAEMKERLEHIRSIKLPFLVAYQRGGKLTGRKKKNIDGHITLPDRLVGVTFADEYNDSVDLYQFTAHLEVFVDNQSYMQGVASCLLDKLLGLLDPTYIERRGFDIKGDEAEGVGATRVIKNLVINVLHDRPEVLEWKARWLENWLGFKQVGYLHGIGEKYGKGVNLAIFQRETGL